MLKHKYLQLTALVLMVFAPMSWGASSVITDQEFLKLCKEGTEQEIIAAINSGANVNAEGNLFDSSDFLGVKDSNNKMSSAVRLLVKLETAVTPLNIVAGRNMPDAVRALVKAGAEVNFTYTQNGRATTLYAAVENDNTETLQILLDAGGDVTITLFNGGTVLAYAASINQNPEVIKMLLKAGADVNSQDSGGWTPLFLASASNIPEVVKVLLDAGADIHSKTVSGRNALMSAADSNTPEVLELLIDAGADVKAIAKSSSGETSTALEYARKNDKLKGSAALKRLEELSK